MPPMSLWRPDKMRDLTYTQFWELVRERQIDSVSLCACSHLHDCRAKAAQQAGNALWTRHVCAWASLLGTARATYWALLLSWQTPPCCLLLHFLRRSGATRQAEMPWEAACLLFPLSVRLQMAGCCNIAPFVLRSRRVLLF